MSSPWENKWDIEEKLGGGGQGATFVVRCKSDANQTGVLKLQVQSRRADPKSRQRMHQEEINLQILSSAAAKVPKVLDTNTSKFGESDDLYFVMERINGESLESLMKRERALSIDEAFDLTLDLCRTLRACHANNIMHRDLKPGNIMIRRRSPIDAVIVDYGLSFNEEEVEQNDLTSHGEAIGNSFTDLPERRTPDAQRHYESDLTAACGILYHCITGQRPNPFRDAFGLPPHRRKQPGLSLRDAMKGHPAAKRLEIVFDRAFEPVISDRFSSAKELIDRLQHARAATANEPKKLAEILASRSSQLIGSSRKVQLHIYSEAASKVISRCHDLLLRGQQNSKFQLQCVPAPPYKDIALPSDMTYLEKGFALGVTVVGIGESSVMEYAFAAQGTQTAMLRRRIEVLPKSETDSSGGGGFGGGGFGGGGGFFGGGTFGGGGGGHVNFDNQLLYIGQITRSPAKPADDWQECLWYPGDGKPDDDELTNELATSVEVLIDELDERLR